MENLKKLETILSIIDNICEKILKNKEFQQELHICVQAVTDICPIVLQNNALSQKFLQILKDMMYGISQKDTVFLLDVLRFGLKPELEIVYTTLKQDNLEVLYE